MRPENYSEYQKAGNDSISEAGDKHQTIFSL